MFFYILLRGEVKGPFPIGMIREMLTAGAIHDMTLAAPEGEKQWRPIGILLNESSHDTDVAGKSVVHTSNNNSMPAKPRKWHTSRNAKIAAALAIGIGVFFLRGRDETTEDESSEATDEAQAPKPQFERQYVSRTAHELYMQGYRNPASAELSREMLSRYPGRANTEGGMKDSLIVLGADDRLQGNPVRLLLE